MQITHAYGIGLQITHAYEIGLQITHACEIGLQITHAYGIGLKPRLCIIHDHYVYALMKHMCPHSPCINSFFVAWVCMYIHVHMNN